MLKKAASQNLISGLLPHVIPGGVVSLQYADDTILFLEKSTQKARKFKWLLSCFENLSGMKINFHKSDLMTINIEDKVVVNLLKSSAVKKVLFLLSIWECLCTMTS